MDQLTSFEVFFTRRGRAFSQVFLNLGSPWQTDSHDFSTSLTYNPTAGWNSFDVSGLSIFVSPGTSLSIGVHGLGSSGVSVGGSSSFSSPGVYAGALSLNGSAYDPQGSQYWDLAFRPLYGRFNKTRIGDRT